MISYCKSSLVIVIIVIFSFFSEHKASASFAPNQGTNLSVSALRKKATIHLTAQQTTTPTSVTPAPTTFKIEKVFARSTAYSHDESESDDDTEAFRSKTQVPLAYLKEGEIGTAAIAGTFGIKFGDLIITPDGRRFLAVDTGKDLKDKKASRELADGRKKKQPKYDSDLYREAEVIDFFSKDNEQVGNEWDTFTVVHNPKDFMSMKVSERKTYLKPEKWQSALAQLSVKSSVLIASD
jgi:hypothetical protein